MAELTNPERRMLRTLKTRKNEWNLDEILHACEWSDQAVAVSAGHGLTNLGLAKTLETSQRDVILGSEGEKALQNGLLESRLWAFIQSNPGASMKDLAQNFEKNEAGPGVGLLKGLGVSLQGGSFSYSNPEQVNLLIKEREDFIANPSLENDLFEHFKGRSARSLYKRV